ncbi:MAG: GreA/GreB family elongation factor [Gammaproteobacteria bacterium]|nr:GreA/GreB family elongation factor [Gammaproteobacteria bacterium]
MSRAFIKESDGEEGDELPELRVSPHRNLVTPVGKGLIETTVERLQSGLTEARAAADRAAIKQIQRDLRYWTERLRTAEVVATSRATGKVRFGSTVTLEKRDGQRLKYQIVGEDEADPANGKISFVSPIAKLLIGSAASEVVPLADGEAEILEIG